MIASRLHGWNASALPAERNQTTTMQVLQHSLGSSTLAREVEKTIIAEDLSPSDSTVSSTSVLKHTQLFVRPESKLTELSDHIVHHHPRVLTDFSKEAPERFRPRFLYLTSFLCV